MLTGILAWLTVKAKWQLTADLAILLFTAIVGDTVITSIIVYNVVALVARAIG